jgi:F-type H+-transporting ATPase subunit delta
MSSSTRQSRQAASQLLDAAKTDLKLADELFAVSTALHSSLQLRGLLSDPSAEAEQKRQASEAVFGAKLSAVALKLVGDLTAMRWSSARDLADTVERLGVRAVAASEGKNLDGLTAELFAVSQLVSSDPELELALSSSQASVAAKRKLISKLVGAKASPAAALLAEAAVSSRTSKRVAQVLASYADWLTEFANESVAQIRVARPLSDSQLTRLGAALSKNFGRNLKLNVVLDEDLVGGVRVAVGGEVIDASMHTRIKQARLQLS